MGGDRLRPRPPRVGKVIASAGLLARGSSLGPAFPGTGPQWHLWPSLSAYSCGGSRGMGPEGPHRIPFSSAGAPAEPK